MAAATVVISETNTVSVTVTDGITNTNMGYSSDASADIPNMATPANYPIPKGSRSYIKYQRMKVSDIGTSSKIDNLKTWRTGALGGAATHLTNARTTVYGGALTYATPVTASVAGVDQTMPSSVPATANLGIGGSLTGSITASGQYSDYLGHQIVTDASDTAGSTTTMNYQYDETA